MLKNRFAIFEGWRRFHLASGYRFHLASGFLFPLGIRFAVSTWRQVFCFRLASGFRFRLASGCCFRLGAVAAREPLHFYFDSQILTTRFSFIQK
jgi:hypothetical protein